MVGAAGLAESRKKCKQERGKLGKNGPLQFFSFCQLFSCSFTVSVIINGAQLGLGHESPKNNVNTTMRAGKKN